MRLSFVGYPGAGKTELAKTLASTFSTMYVSSGDLIRANGFAGSKDEKDGKLSSNEDLVRSLVTDAITGSDMYMIDGFPRMYSQIEEVDVPFDAVIHVNTGLDECINRLLLRGRPDDTIDTIRKRINTYREHTHPLIDYWFMEGKLIMVNGDRPKSDVVGEAIVKLAKFGIVEADKYISRLMKGFNNDR